MLVKLPDGCWTHQSSIEAVDTEFSAYDGGYRVVVVTSDGAKHSSDSMSETAATAEVDRTAARFNAPLLATGQMRYKILANCDRVLIAETVNKHLSDGWSLYGNPFTNGEYYCQALIGAAEPEILAVSECLEEASA